MHANPAACPHCRARLGLRTIFALGDLWDPRIRSMNGLGLEFRCYDCARALRYPVNTLASFIALAILPVVLMALLRDSGLLEWSTSIPTLLGPYWIGLGALYSFLATPILSNTARTQSPLPRRPNTKNTTARISPTMKRIQAMFADTPAIPPNPSSAATSAIIRNTAAQYNMSPPCSVEPKRAIGCSAIPVPWRERSPSRASRPATRP
jgi:hypothetical protein